MALEYEVVSPKGIKIRCSSLEAADRLVKKLEQAIADPDIEEWNATDFEDFTGRLQHLPRRLLKLLLNTYEDVSDADIRSALGLANNRVLAGVLSGISKVALALSIDPNRVYKQRIRYQSGLPQRQYAVTKAFRKAAVELYDWKD